VGDRKGPGRLWFPITVFALGVVSTALVATQIQQTADTQDRERFEVAVEQVQDAIRARLEMYVAMLRAGAGLLAATDLHSAPQFHAFVERLELQERYSGVQGIGYTARITPSELGRIVAAQRRTNPRFRVWPEEPRSEYHAILYLEPLDRRNQAAIGYDMFTEPTRRAAMERARDTGEPAASGAVTLVQEIDEVKQLGFLIYMPVYSGAAPTTIEDRRRRLRGFVYSPFRAGDLFAGILGRHPRPRAGFELFDGAPSPTALLHRTVVEGRGRRFSDTRTIDVAGRTWTATMFSTAALEQLSSSALVPHVLWGGGAITVLLTGLAVLQARARRRAEQSEAAAEAASQQVQQVLARERSARAEAERVSQVKDEFLATLSHELRTPLNAVVGWAHMLSSGSLGESRRQAAVETILRNARIQSQLIEELLDMSRIISGRAGLELSLVSVRTVVEAALDVVRPTAAAKRVELAFDAAAGTHRVRGDNNRLQQIVWNLLTNAIKFTPSGGRVTVGLAQRDGEVEITVTDTGIGIEPAFLPYVFERFRQADASFTRGHGGLGLGLSIVHSLVEMHAGTIQASSAGLNQGARFTVRLPAADDEAMPDRDVDLRDARPVDAHSLDSAVVLIVDDDVDSGDLASEILSPHGARVLLARSGVEALRLMQSNGAAIELIVSDLGMPQMDGYELIRRVRALPPDKGGAVPAIALTAYAAAADRSRAIAAGYNLHVAKPFAPADLVGACATLLRTRAI
jgi:signal transduction histidine kinase